MANFQQYLDYTKYTNTQIPQLSKLFTLDELIQYNIIHSPSELIFLEPQNLVYQTCQLRTNHALHKYFEKNTSTFHFSFIDMFNFFQYQISLCDKIENKIICNTDLIEILGIKVKDESSHIKNKSWIYTRFFKQIELHWGNYDSD